MDFGPMVSALMRNKTGAVLVAVQIAVTLAIVINSLYIIVLRVEKINRETGIDVENVIVAYVRGFGESFDVVDSITNDIDLIKSIPGVRTATVANQVPLSGSGSGTGLRTEPDETIESVPTARFRWSEDGLDALGVELTRGRNFYPEEVNYILPASDPPAPASILVTQQLANDLFGEEDALGKTVYWGSMEPSTIVGIIGRMQGSWVGWDKLENAVIQPGKPAFTADKYIIRVEPGMRDELIPVIEKKLGESNRQRVLIAMRTLGPGYGDHIVGRYLPADWPDDTRDCRPGLISRHATYQTDRHPACARGETYRYHSLLYAGKLDDHDHGCATWRLFDRGSRLLAGGFI